MEELLLYTPQYVQNSVAFSRNREEEIGLASGSQGYGNFAGLVSRHLHEIDAIFESASEQAALFAVNRIDEEQFKNPKNGRIRNWFNRNVYIDPLDKKGQEIIRYAAYGAVKGVGEIALKSGVRALISALNERDRLKFYSGIYNFLYLMANSDPQANMVNAAVELEKIRSSFDLNANSRKKVKEIASANRVHTLDELDFGFLNRINSDTKMGLAYLLYSLACRMYDDDPEAVAAKLRDYYDILGYHDKRCNEVIRIQQQSYETVMDNQHMMHTIASQMVTHIIPESPFVDLQQIMRRGQEISKFDPYSKRRKKVRKGVSNIGKFALKAVPLTIRAVCEQNPTRAILAASEAFSQFNLGSDRVLEEGANTLYNWFGSPKAVEAITANAQSLANDSRSFE